MTIDRPTGSRDSSWGPPSGGPLSSPELDASVVIVTWNGRQYLEACLSAVAAQQGVSFETILVDNASADGTVEYVRERFPDVRIVALKENTGFAGGNNAGVRAARGRYVALLNNDTVPERGWLRALLRGLDDDARAREAGFGIATSPEAGFGIATSPEAGFGIATSPEAGFGLATSRIVFMHNPQVIDSAGDGLLRWGGAFKLLHGAGVDSAAESREVFGVCGAACAMPRRVYDELGGFDEDFFASHEDVDLSYRARLLGYRCRYVADAVVLHHGSATLGRMSSFAVFHAQRNLEWLYVKNTPGWLLLRTLPGHLLYVAAGALHFARLRLLGTFLRAKLAALAGLPRMLRKRAAIQGSRRVDASEIWPQLEARWLSTKVREKRFDLGLVEPRG